MSWFELLWKSIPLVPVYNNPLHSWLESAAAESYWLIRFALISVFLVLSLDFDNLIEDVIEFVIQSLCRCWIDVSKVIVNRQVSCGDVKVLVLVRVPTRGSLRSLTTILIWKALAQIIVREKVCVYDVT